MTKHERFCKLLRYIIYANDLPIIGIMKVLGEKIGMSNSNISAAYNGNERYLTVSLMKRINAAYGSPFNMDWLAHGVGEMLSKDATPIGNENMYHSQQDTIEKLAESVDRLSRLIKKEV